ncbi:DUF2490 domain-containing protein [Fulvivirga lutea]|uniref:DUF2490 domain-containing protein n=1 Tax=Fulvivirga lutea TaxID=2810512 RepID=A0A974WNJ2_9BACT|nr:DUF2490 domain-containing protein [Fulvivirga lutea]QSE98748.1 DUF2490 domain-containing protein [Fulvivirga lutea]
MKNTLLITVLLTIFINFHSYSQEIHGRDDVWFMMLHTFKLNDKWDVGNEIHLRFDDYLNDDQQFLLRPFFNYYANANIIYSGGYTYIRTYPYGQYPLPETKPEHNIWEQITFNQQINKSIFAHRYRLEHRWQANLAEQTDGSFEVDDYDFSHRLRYRLMYRRPLNDAWEIVLFDELFINSSDDLKSVGFDRNWFFIGTNYHFSDRLSLLGGYMHHYAKNSADRFERHPTAWFIFDWRLN